MWLNKVFLGLTISVYLMMVGCGMVVAFLPRRIIELSGSADTIAYLATFYAMAYICFQLVIGKLSDRIGFKQFIVVGYFLCFLSGLTFFYSSTASAVLFGRLLLGMGEAPVFALAPALLSLKFPSYKGKTIGLYNAAIHLGLMTGPGLGLVIQKHWTDSAVFLFYAGVCLVGAIILVAWLGNEKKEADDKTMVFGMPQVRSLMAHKKIRLILAGASLYGAAYGSFFTVVPDTLIREIHFSPGYIGLYFSLTYFGISCAQLLIGPLSDKFGPRVFLVAGLVVAAPGFVLFPYLPTVSCIVVLMLSSFGFGAFFLSSLSLLSTFFPTTQRGCICGVFFFFWGLGMFFGPPLLVRLSYVLNARTGFSIFAALLLAEAAALYKATVREGKEQA